MTVDIQFPTRKLSLRGKYFETEIVEKQCVFDNISMLNEYTSNVCILNANFHVVMINKQRGNVAIVRASFPSRPFDLLCFISYLFEFKTLEKIQLLLLLNWKFTKIHNFLEIYKIKKKNKKIFKIVFTK